MVIRFEGRTLMYGIVFVSHLIVSKLCSPMDCSPKGFSVHGILQEYQSGLHCLLQGGLPDPGIAPGSPALQVNSLHSETQGFSSV